MSIREEPWANGTPCWSDLTTTDQPAAIAFYTRMFGWQVEDKGPRMGHYGLAMIRHRPIAGITPAPPGPQAPPPVWITYLSTDDVDKSCSLVGSYGGTVLTGPMDVGSDGRAAMAVDPTGAIFGLWQPRNHIGAQMVNEPGAMCWNECMTRDAAAAKDFYHAVFGFRYCDVEIMSGYTMIARPEGDLGPETAIGGIAQIAPNQPAPSHWMTYFAVADTSQAVTAVAEAGGSVVAGPMSTPYGPMAICRDPQGAMFSVIRLPLT